MLVALGLYTTTRHVECRVFPGLTNWANLPSRVFPLLPEETANRKKVWAKPCPRCWLNWLCQCLLHLPGTPVGRQACSLLWEPCQSSPFSPIWSGQTRHRAVKIPPPQVILEGFGWVGLDPSKDPSNQKQTDPPQSGGNSKGSTQSIIFPPLYYNLTHPGEIMFLSFAKETGDPKVRSARSGQFD